MGKEEMDAIGTGFDKAIDLLGSIVYNFFLLLGGITVIAAYLKYWWTGEIIYFEIFVVLGIPIIILILIELQKPIY